MEQEMKLLEEQGNVGEAKSKIPNWVLAGFKNEEEYNELLKKIDVYLETHELHPWVKEVSGMVNSGKEESTETIFSNDVKKNLYETKKHVMKQEIELLEKKGNVAEVKSKAPNWLLAGFKNEEEYNELLKKIDARFKTEKLNPVIAKISGIISTGRNDTVESIFE